MMIGDGDDELYLLQRFDKSLQNVLAQTMVGQDEIFRNQVLELHRLCHVQKILMQEMDLKICMSRQTKGNFLRECTSVCLKHEQGPINLELLASKNTNLNGDVRHEKCGSITPGAFVKKKCGFDNVKASPMDELKLSLSLNTETWKTCHEEKSQPEQIIYSPSQHYMNLKDSSENSKQELVSISSLEYATFSDYELNFEPSSSIWRRKNEYQGVEQCHGDLLGKVNSTRRKLLTSNEVVELDLNRALPEELSFSSTDHLIPYSSKSTMSDLNGSEREIKCLSDPSNSDKQEMMYSTLTTSPSKDTGEVNCGSTLPSVDLRSIYRPASISKNPGCCSNKYRSENSGFQLNLPHRSPQEISMHEVNAEERKECVLHSHDSSQEFVEGVGSNRFPASSKSDSTPEDISSNIKKEECGVDKGRSPSTFQDHDPSRPAKKLCWQNTVPSIKPKSKSQASNQKNSELSEVDISIKNGSVSLIYLSSVCSANNQDYVPCSSRREISNVVREVPQCSSESYESIVLKQPEINLYEYSVTSIPFEANNPNEKDYGTKLKRGRRMKDFRKEVLPGLASLSRQEICEDVRIMRGAIRSREFKKYGSKMRGTGDGFSPLKSKRSRHSHARRRCYS